MATQESRNFAISIRGYDRDEVDAYVQELTDELRTLRAQLESVERDLTEARARATAAVQESIAARESVVDAAPPPPAPPDPDQAFRQIGEETSKILIAARQSGEEIVGKARNEAAELLLHARREAKKIADDAERARIEYETDLARLREARALLSTQLEDIQRRLGESVSRLQNPVEESALNKRVKIPPKAEPVVLESQWAEDALPAEAEVPAEPSSSAAVDVADTPEIALESPDTTEVAGETAPEQETTPQEQEPAPVKEEPAAATRPSEDGAERRSSGLDELLQEIRREREEGRRQVEEALASTRSEVAVEEATTAEADQTDVVAESPPMPELDPAIQRRSMELGDTPQTTARRIKRLLQEEQNDLLDRLRRQRGKGTLDDNLAPFDEQLQRFKESVSDPLQRAFAAGRRAGGAEDAGDPSHAVGNLILKQLLTPLRNEVSRAVETGLQAGDTPTAVSERASDIFRVWKGVRTQLLGEGMVYAAYHHGLVDAWKAKSASTKRWVFSTDEMECPREVCKSNAEGGDVALDAPFPSGHTAPPAHGGCSCTLSLPSDSSS